MIHHHVIKLPIQYLSNWLISDCKLIKSSKKYTKRERERERERKRERETETETERETERDRETERQRDRERESRSKTICTHIKKNAENPSSKDNADNSEGNSSINSRDITLKSKKLIVLLGNSMLKHSNGWEMSITLRATARFLSSIFQAKQQIT